MRGSYLLLLHFPLLLAEKNDVKLAIPRKPGINRKKPDFLPSSHIFEYKYDPLRSSCSSSSSSSSQEEDDIFREYESGYHENFKSRCEEACCQDEPFTKWIEDMDFYHIYPILEGGRKNWHYVELADGTFQSNGGNLITGKKGGFLDTIVYSLSANQTQIPELDHLKYLIFANKEAPVPGDGTLVIEWKASAKTYNTDTNPFGSQLTLPHDPRLASAGFLASDPDHGLTFGYLLTNDRVYVYYSRQPYLRLILEEPYAAFTYMIPVKVRSCSEIHRLRIDFDRKEATVVWYVDYRQVFKLETVGSRLKSKIYLTMDYGGFSSEAFPRRLEYGFGSFTFLDNYPTCYRELGTPECMRPPTPKALVKLGNEAQVFPQYNPAIGMPHESTYFDEAGLLRNRLWGQGSETRIFQMSVYQIINTC